MTTTSKRGKTVGLVAPSFFVEKKTLYYNGIKYLKYHGYNVVIGDKVLSRNYNTTCSAKERADEINRMFLNPDIDIVLATDGGCRAIEILEHLNYGIIHDNPKPFCGFSDITHILLAIYSKTTNKVIHGMDLINGFGVADSSYKEKNIQLFWNNINQNEFCVDLRKGIVLKKGNGSGVAIGGWLNAIVNLLHTPYFPKDSDIVLLWEAIDEEPNKISMMLQVLRASGILKRVRGMVVGQLTNCIEKEYFDCVPPIEEMILSACEGYSFPIITNAPFGHGEKKQSFTYGTEIEIKV